MGYFGCSSLLFWGLLGFPGRLNLKTLGSGLGLPCISGDRVAGHGGSLGASPVPGAARQAFMSKGFPTWRLRGRSFKWNYRYRDDKKSTYNWPRTSKYGSLLQTFTFFP